MANVWQISAEKVANHYEVLNGIGCLGDTSASGFLRVAYSDEETAAMKYIESCACALGAKSRWDKVGNLCLEWRGSSEEFVEIGSHMDTVPYGGNFDGAAGIVAGLLAIEKIIENVPVRRRGMRLRIWRGEEFATFNALYIGSSAAFGKLRAQALLNVFQGNTLEVVMRSQGADPEVVRRGEATITQEEIDSIVAHVELHIEQGNLLEVKKKDVGIVTSIRGPRRLRVELLGAFDHSGATPMGVEFRRDCNLALAYISVALDQLAQQKRDEGADLVQTVGVINSARDFNEKTPTVYANAVPKVSGYAYFCLDMRSNNRAFLESYVVSAREVIANIASQYRVTANIEAIGQSDPLESMNEDIQSRFEEAAHALKISSVRMPSGAGHDTAIVGAQKRTDGSFVNVGMLFIPCRGGKSHCPEEFTSYEAIAKGASVLAFGLSGFVVECS